MTSINSITCSTVEVPLTRPWGPDVPTVSVVKVELLDSDGARGHGFSWTPSIGSAAVQALIEQDLAPWAIGRPTDEWIWADAWRHVHEAGGGGVTTIALAGLDLAMWDLRCRVAGHGLDDELGRHHESQPVYGSGVNLHYSLDDLVAQAGRWRDAGVTAVKFKVGSPDLNRDVERVRVVREVVGDDIGIMLDANQRWDLEQATVAIERLAEFDLIWMEEPLLADDTVGYVELRRRVDVPIALGENAHHWFRFRDLIDAGACDVVQPNVVRVGGVSPFLSVVALARDRGVTLAPHLLPDLSARLAVTLPETTWVEDVEDADFASLGALVRPSGVVISQGRAMIEPTLGIGVEFR